MSKKRAEFNKNKNHKVFINNNISCHHEKVIKKKLQILILTRNLILNRKIIIIKTKIHLLILIHLIKFLNSGLHAKAFSAIQVKSIAPR